jgi:N-acetyl-anhydromuramyl-L-alanine amidase AmpD
MSTPVGPPGPLPIVYHDARYVVDRRHYTAGRGGWPPTWIVWHSTEGTDSRAWLSITPGSGVSIHKLIRPEGVYSLVAPRDTAWHCGTCAFPDGTPFVDANARTLGVEIEHLGDAPYSRADYTALAHTTAGWCFSYGIPLERVLLHRDIAVWPPDHPRAGQFGRRTDPVGLDVAWALRLTAQWLAWFQTLPPADHARFIF